MLIERDFSRTEHDDFHLNIAKFLDGNNEAILVEGTFWRIQPRYE